MQRLSAFELAVLEQLAKENPRYQGQLRELCALAEVSNRRLTGIGVNIDLAARPIHFEPPNFELSASADISVPMLEHGLAATLFVRLGEAAWLEVWAYAAEDWSGETTGFRISPRMAGHDAA
jgi:hypothetical protein